MNGKRTFRFDVENPNTRVNFDIDFVLMPKPAHQPQRLFRIVVDDRLLGRCISSNDEEAEEIARHLLSLGAEELIDGKYPGER